MGIKPVNFLTLCEHMSPVIWRRWDFFNDEMVLVKLDRSEVEAGLNHDYPRREEIMGRIPN
jgi:hypothetical protein